MCVVSLVHVGYYDCFFQTRQVRNVGWSLVGCFTSLSFTLYLLSLALSGASREPVAQDKFLIQGYMFENESPIPDVSQLSNYWKTIKGQRIFESRYYC